MTTTLDDVVVAGSADIREMAFANLELCVAGWGKIAGMLDDRHPLAQAAIGLNMMAEHSLRAIALTPAHVMASSDTGGAAIMKVPAEATDSVGETAETERDVRKPWAVAHANRKHYCIGRKEGCPYSVHGNSIHKHMMDCEIAKAIRVREAKALLADTKAAKAAKVIQAREAKTMLEEAKATKEAKAIQTREDKIARLANARAAKDAKKAQAREAKIARLADAAKTGIVDDGTAGKVMKLPASKPDRRSMTKRCIGHAAGCVFETKSGRWIARHQAECVHAKAAATSKVEKPVEKSVEKPVAKVNRATKYCSGRDAGCGFSTKSDRWIARHQNTCGIAKKTERAEKKVESDKPTSSGKKTKTRSGSTKRKAG